MTRLLMTADAVGGVWQYATGLAAALAPRFKTVLAVMGPPPPEAACEAAERAGVRLVHTGLPLDWLAVDETAIRSSAAAIADVAAECRADIVHLNTPALAGLARFPAPAIAVAHSDLATWWACMEGSALPADFAWRAQLTAQGLAAAARVVAPSASYGEALHRAFRLSVAPSVVHNGRVPLDLPPAFSRAEALTVGRLWDRSKGMAVLDRSAMRLSVPLLAAGPLEGPRGESVYIRHARALGTVDEKGLAGLLAGRPVFVSAARYEPFGLAVLEAAQAGCALVLSDIPTFRELWEGAACFVPAQDDAGFAAAIEALIGDPARRHALGEAARLASAPFTVQAMAAGMHAILAPLASRRAAA